MFPNYIYSPRCNHFWCYQQGCNNAWFLENSHWCDIMITYNTKPTFSVNYTNCFEPGLNNTFSSAKNLILLWKKTQSNWQNIFSAKMFVRPWKKCGEKFHFVSCSRKLFSLSRSSLDVHCNNRSNLFVLLGF